MFPLLRLPASVLITTIEVSGSCLDVTKCIDDVDAPPTDLAVARSLIDADVVIPVLLFVEDIDFTLLARPEN